MLMMSNDIYTAMGALWLLGIRFFFWVLHLMTSKKSLKIDNYK
jgi:hypothetical protein